MTRGPLRFLVHFRSGLGRVQQHTPIPYSPTYPRATLSVLKYLITTLYYLTECPEQAPNKIQLLEA